MKTSKPFYKSKAWLRKRERILRRDGYMCQESRRFGRTKPAEMIHHIYPLEDYPELALEDWNLISLANNVHNTFHDRNSNKIIGRGLYWQKKFRSEFEKFFGAPPPKQN